MRQSIRKSVRSYIPYKNPLIQVPKQLNSLHQPQQAGTQLVTVTSEIPCGKLSYMLYKKNANILCMYCMYIPLHRQDRDRKTRMSLVHKRH